MAPVESARHSWASAAFTQLIEVERSAARIWQNQPLFVPGLLQTEDYAAAVISALSGLGLGDPELAARVDQRMQRGAALVERLDGDDAPVLTTVIDEAVLRRSVGTPGVMRDQLARLAELAARYPTLRIAVPPLGRGAHAGLAGSFEVHDRAEAAPAVFFEDARGDLFVTDEEVARRHIGIVETLAASCIPTGGPGAMPELLDGIAASL